jgi:hypothetical protein
MKTKSLLALAVAGLAMPVAFGAVSSNIVGYTTLTLSEGYNLVANTLSNQTSNAVADLFNSTPAGTAVFRWNGTGFDEYDNLGGTWFTPDNPPALNPGEAVFVQIPSGSGKQNVTLIGQVLTGAQSLKIVASPGFNFVASVIPKAGALDTDLGYTPTLGDAVFTWNGAGYDENDFFGAGAGWSSGSSPALAIGQGIVLSAAAAGTWTQTFTPSTN